MGEQTAGRQPHGELQEEQGPGVGEAGRGGLCSVWDGGRGLVQPDPALKCPSFGQGVGAGSHTAPSPNKLFGSSGPFPLCFHAQAQLGGERHEGLPEEVHVPQSHRLPVPRVWPGLRGEGIGPEFHCPGR